MSTFLTTGALLESTLSLASSLTPYQLTASSQTIIVVQGSAAQVILLPIATTVRVGVRYFIANRCSVTIEVRDADGNRLTYIEADEQKEFRNLDTSSSAGSWDVWTSRQASPTGFLDRAESNLSYVDGTNTLTITPVGTYFDYYIKGKLYRISSPQSVVIPNDATQIYYAYMNESGILAYTTTLDLSLHTDYSYVALIYWNLDTTLATLVLDQRHLAVMDGATKFYIYSTIGAQFVSGLDAGNYTLAGTGAADADAQLSLTDGLLAIQDIQFPVTDGSPQELTPILQIPIFFRSGVGGSWDYEMATNFPLLAGITRPAYNLDTLGTWTTPDIPSDGLFFAVYLFSSSDIRFPIIGILGQRTDTTLDNAKEGNSYLSIDFGDLPVNDLRVLYRLIFTESSAFANTPKAALREILDLRYASPGDGASTAITLKDGGFEHLTDTTDSTYTIPSGRVNVHFFMNVLIGHTLTVDNGARLVSSDDTINGTVVVNPGGIWKVL